jgi:heterodisulfide reductase subunit A2
MQFKGLGRRSDKRRLLKGNRDQIDKPVTIHAIERFLGDMDLKAKKRYVPEMKPKRKEKVAIISSGPAGLTCAYYLAQEGYKVTIFKKAKVLGGMFTAGIPSYRLPGNIVEAEIKVIRNMGVTMKTGVEVGKDKTIAQLRKDGFKAFFLAIGAQKGVRLGVPDEDLDGVYRGVDYLRQPNLGKPIKLGERVAVIGGGMWRWMRSGLPEGWGPKRRLFFTDEVWRKCLLHRKRLSSVGK